MFYLSELNEAQRSAVVSPLQHSLILAGAGSGKTKVLVSRIAFLIHKHKIQGSEITALTFTNKASQEMKKRLAKWGVENDGAWMGTFHSWGYHFLRHNFELALLDKNFLVLDQDEQTKAIKKVIEDNYTKQEITQIDLKEVVSWINKNKELGLRPHHITPKTTELHIFKNIYDKYMEYCDKTNRVDFGELLLRSVETLKNNPLLLDRYREAKKFWLVDEFQDTSVLQYEFLKMMVGEKGVAFVVGDDGQSIYGWRQARVENMIDFLEDFKDAKIYKLEQNYRSTSHILNLANGLLENNYQRKEFKKVLWTTKEKGDLPLCVAYEKDIDEAKDIAQKIAGWKNSGVIKEWKDVAILYRMNAQSRLFEETLMGQGVPYVIYGGLKFFDRQEIKDALSYLKLLTLKKDDQSWERCLNNPTRGIGDKVREEIKGISRKNEISLFEASELWVSQVSEKQGKKVKEWLDMFNRWSVEWENLTLQEQMKELLKDTALILHYEKQKQKEPDSDKVENLNQLVAACERFQEKELDIKGQDIRLAFLSYASMENDPIYKESEDAVQLMTLHTAKGLEFPCVFLVGWEQNLFPSQRSLSDKQKVEEERRLAYVGITRAEKILQISHASSRNLFGGVSSMNQSMFIKELPSNHFETKNLIAKMMYGSQQQKNNSYFSLSTNQQNSSNSNQDKEIWRKGNIVKHKDFGEGLLLQEMTPGFWKTSFKNIGTLTISIKDSRWEK